MDIAIVIVLIVVLGLIGGLAFVAWDRRVQKQDRTRRSLHVLPAGAPAGQTLEQVCRDNYDIRDPADWQDLYDCAGEINGDEELVILRRHRDGRRIWIFKYKNVPHTARNRGDAHFATSFQLVYGDECWVHTNWRLVTN